ncbi:MAG: hypothetical protein ACTSXZ_05100 [Alphaproteobacteria bacterium]
MPHWKPIDEGAGLWAHERFKDGVSILRSTAVRLADGDLAVIGPIREKSEAAREQLRALGRPAILLAPNHYHNAGLALYQREFSDCVVVASAVAAPRLRKKTPCASAPLELLRARLPRHMSLLEPPGTRTGEVWLRAGTGGGVAWVVGDAFFNMRAAPRSFMGVVMRLFGNAPGLRIGGTFTWLALRNNREYAAWLTAQLEADNPAILIPAHGDIEAGDDLPDRLRALAAARLPAR